ncbi:hypothetical protein GCM10009827_074110 [Dactylosporangium maewongense]|uniref:Uncharacterized protein n=1 Tax=Dactylosporangium maewongense TaxID=634393 RepID=A0ABN2BQ13_9ACTN
MVVPLAERTWAVRISTVRLGDRQYRVIRPARAVGFGGLYEGRLGAQFCLDKHTAATLATAWGLAARSPHSIVFLPVRAARRPDRCSWWGRPLDLVLLHHRLAVPASRWKQIRGRLGAGAPYTVTLPAGAWPDRPVADHRRVWNDGYRDHLRWQIAADTLVLTGSREAFDLQTEQLRQLAEDCPAHLAVTPGTHCCAEINLGRIGRYHDRRNPPAELHVEYCRLR